MIGDLPIFTPGQSLRKAGVVIEDCGFQMGFDGDLPTGLRLLFNTAQTTLLSNHVEFVCVCVSWRGGGAGLAWAQGVASVPH